MIELIITLVKVYLSITYILGAILFLLPMISLMIDGSFFIELLIFFILSPYHVIRLLVE